MGKKYAFVRPTQVMSCKSCPLMTLAVTTNYHLAAMYLVQKRTGNHWPYGTIISVGDFDEQIGVLEA